MSKRNGVWGSGSEMESNGEMGSDGAPLAGAAGKRSLTAAIPRYGPADAVQLRGGGDPPVITIRGVLLTAKSGETQFRAVEAQLDDEELSNLRRAVESEDPQKVAIALLALEGVDLTQVNDKATIAAAYQVAGSYISWVKPQADVATWTTALGELEAVKDLDPSKLTDKSIGLLRNKIEILPPSLRAEWSKLLQDKVDANLRRDDATAPPSGNVGIGVTKPDQDGANVDPFDFAFLKPMQPITPDEIRNEYQVKSEELVTWRATLGIFDIPLPDRFAHETTVTKTEGEMLDGLDLFEKLDFNDIAKEAQEVAEARYPLPSEFPADAPPAGPDRGGWVGNDGHRDAFRHAYWSALLTRHFGEEWARRYTMAHEAVPDNVAEREAMDLYNNEVGRFIAAANPDASSAELADAVESAVSAGRLVVIDKDSKLAFSNEVALWHHGHTGSATIEGKLDVPDEPTHPRSQQR